MRRLCWFLSILLLALAAGWRPLPASAQASATKVLVSPAKAQVAAGQALDLTVEAREVSGLYGFEIWLAYNPADLEISDADPDQPGAQVALGVFLENGYTVLNQVDPAKGEIRFAMTQIAPSEPRSGSGTLLVIPLRGLRAQAASPVTITHLVMATQDGEEISCTTANSTVDILSESEQSAAQATHVPTQIPSRLTRTPEITAVPEMTATPGLSATSTSTASSTQATPNPGTEVTPEAGQQAESGPAAESTAIEQPIAANAEPESNSTPTSQPDNLGETPGEARPAPIWPWGIAGVVIAGGAAFAWLRSRKPSA